MKNIQDAFVIHARAYKETSLLLNIFTRNDGLINAIAKGAKRKKSKFSGYLEPFQLIEISYLGKSDLKTLTSAEPKEVFQEFLNKENLFSAFYVNELINSLFKKGTASKEYFDLYDDCIKKLKFKNNVEEILRNFELDTLIEMGYEINFVSDCRSNLEITTEKNYDYQPESGFCESAKGIHGNTIKKMADRTFDRTTLDACKVVTRRTLEYYFQELNVNSRLFFR